MGSAASDAMPELPPHKPDTPKRDPDKTAAADDALEAARGMPPGPERMAALKKAGLLRHALGLTAIVFPRKGRPPK